MRYLEFCKICAIFLEETAWPILAPTKTNSLRTTILTEEMKSDQELGELHSVVDGEQFGGQEPSNALLISES